MKMHKLTRSICPLFVAIVTIFILNGCSKQPESIDYWKSWVLTRAKVEDYTAMDLISNFIDEREKVALYSDYHKEFEQWWVEEINFKWRGHDEFYTQNDNEFHLEQERKDFSEYYSVLAEFTLLNALSLSDEDEDDFEKELEEVFTRVLLGSGSGKYEFLSYLEKVEENLDLSEYGKLTRTSLKESMVKVIGNPSSFSLYEEALKLNNSNYEEKWWEPVDVVHLAMDFQEEFFGNVMALLGDFGELEQMIDETVSVYSCEYNSELSSDKADVYDVIYSIKDKLYVKCSILETGEKSEIKIVNKSSHLLSL